MLASRRSIKFLWTRSQLYHQTNMLITDMLLITEPAYKERLTGYLPFVRRARAYIVGLAHPSFLFLFLFFFLFLMFCGLVSQSGGHLVAIQCLYLKGKSRMIWLASCIALVPRWLSIQATPKLARHSISRSLRTPNLDRDMMKHPANIS